jgi:hypothetical protein
MILTNVKMYKQISSFYGIENRLFQLKRNLILTPAKSSVNRKIDIEYYLNRYIKTLLYF